MCTKFNASQTEIVDLFQVERKKFFTSIMGHEYNPGRKPTKSENLKTSPTKKDKSTEKHADELQPSQQPAATEVDPKNATTRRHPTKEEILVQGPRVNPSVKTFSKLNH